jgi:hypothetical protein
MAEEKEQDQVTEEEEPQEPEQEPETAEEEPAEEEGLQLTDEQIEALLSAGEPSSGEPAAPSPARPPAAEPQKPPAREAAPAPVTSEATDEQSFMPQGQSFDPYEAFTPGTASFVARQKAEEARIGRVVSQAIQSDREKAQANEYQRRWHEFVSANPDMKDERKRQEFEQFLMTTAVDGAPLDYTELYNAMRFTKAMRTQRRRKAANAGRQVPPPVTMAPRSTIPKEPADLQKQVNELIGPDRGGGY